MPGVTGARIASMYQWYIDGGMAELDRDVGAARARVPSARSVSEWFNSTGFDVVLRACARSRDAESL
jgi:hypothetical protein